MATPPPPDHPTLDGWLGPREAVGENDTRRQIKQLARSQAVAEEDTIGPACFGPRIRNEPFPRGFMLPRDTPKYTGSVKPEDWLIDYSTAVSIANDNKRVAVKYVSLMLQGTARTRLNSLKPQQHQQLVGFQRWLRPELHQHVQAASQASPTLHVRPEANRVHVRLPHMLGRVAQLL